MMHIQCMECIHDRHESSPAGFEQLRLEGIEALLVVGIEEVEGEFEAVVQVHLPLDLAAHHTRLGWIVFY